MSRLTRSAMMIFAGLLSCPSAMQASEVISASALVSALADPLVIEDYTAQMRGSLEAYVDGLPLLYQRTSFVMTMLDDAARGCGTKVVFQSTGDADRYVRLVTMEQPSADKILAEISTMGGMGTVNLGPNGRDLAEKSFARLQRQGFDVLAVYTGTPQRRQIVKYAIWDAAGLAGSDAAARLDAVIFATMAGLPLQPDAVDENAFGYFFGGGTLDQLTADAGDRYVQFCRGIGLVKLTCDGAFGPTIDTSSIPQTLTAVADQCVGTAGTLRRLDQSIQKEHSVT